MDKYIVDRVLKEAEFIVDNKSTVRDIANVYKVSKSTVHKDLTERLHKIDVELYLVVEDIFNEHTKTRHIRGGEATKQKYLKR